MPIYQYECSDCEERVDVFVRSASSTRKPACPQCDGKRLMRVMSSFARGRSARDRVDSVDVNQELGRLGSGDEGDFARWARRMGREYDEELGTDYREVAERAEAGEDPIERFEPDHKIRMALQKKKRPAAAAGGGGDGDGAGG